MSVDLKQEGLEVLVTSENDVILDNGNRMECVTVDGCDSPALVAVDLFHGGITAMDVLTGDKVSEFPPLS
jgi:hypothetical protein